MPSPLICNAFHRPQQWWTKGPKLRCGTIPDIGTGKGTDQLSFEMRLCDLVPVSGIHVRASISYTFFSGRHRGFSVVVSHSYGTVHGQPSERSVYYRFQKCRSVYFINIFAMDLLRIATTLIGVVTHSWRGGDTRAPTAFFSFRALNQFDIAV